MNDELEGCMIALGLVVLLVGIGVIVGVSLVELPSSRAAERAEWQRETVRRGYAEYYLDANNQAAWRWKDSDTTDSEAAR